MKKIIIILFIVISLVSSVYGILPSTHTAIKSVTAKDLDMSNVTDVNNKKKRFFDFLRPIINDENTKVLALREKLLNAKKNNNNKAFVAKTAADYSVEWAKGDEDWDTLLKRVNAVHLELALAQSANESAWGQSRFAKEGNNFFGQWCYKKGCGIVPAKRNKYSKHEVAKFDSVNDSVRSYIKNINTGSVYLPLRNIRKKNKVAGNKPNAHAQAGGLVKYSERREEYVKDIRSMIQANKEIMTTD